MRKLIFFLLNLMACGFLCAQESPYLFNRTPETLKVETPNAASFNKYIDNPIGLYTGAPDVNIPLYTLKDGSIEVPITLRYNTSGIKVNEEAGWVGLGWNLNVGGVITRQAVGGIDRHPIRGSEVYNADKNIDTIMNIYDPDRDRKPVDFITTPWSNRMREAFDWFLREPSMRLVQDEGRLSPDVFYFSYPGASGKFIIDQRNDSVYVMERENDVRIELVLEKNSPAISVTSDGRGITRFIMTQPEGIVHYFDYFSNVLTSDAATRPLSETYVLVKTVYPNGQKVRYTYDSYMHYNFIYSEQIQSGDNRTARRLDSTALPADLQRSYGSQLLTVGSGREFVLATMSTDNYSVEFVHSDREDLPDVRKLDHVIVTNHMKMVKRVCFEYDYFQGRSDIDSWSVRVRSSLLNSKRTTNHFTKRLKLLSVYSLGEQEEEADKYSFFYNNKQLPRKDSFAMDYWGYYNGQTSNHSYIPEAYNLMWHRSADYDKIKKMPVQSGTEFSLAQRGYDFSYCVAGMLTGVQYPTGGYKSFIYEPNTFVDYIIPTIAQTKDNTLNFRKQIRDNNSSQTPPDIRVWSYRFEEDTYVTLTVRVYRGGNSWQSVINHTASVSGVPSLDLSLSAECKAMQEDWEKYHIDKGPSVSKTAEVLIKKGLVYFVVNFPDGLGDQTVYGRGGDITMDISFKVSAEGKRENEGAGLRIKEIVSYDSPGQEQVLLWTGYEYMDPITKKSSGVLQKKLRFVNFYPQTVDVLGTVTSTACSFPKVDKMAYSSDKFEIGSDNYLSTPYQSSPDVGYTCVKETRRAEGEAAGHTIYYFHNQEPRAAEHSISLHDPLNGKMEKAEYYHQEEGRVRTETYNYDSDIYHYYYGFTFYDRLNLFANIFSGSGRTMLEMSETNESFFYRQCDFGSIYSETKFNHRSAEKDYLYDRLALYLYPLNAYNVTLRQKIVVEDNVAEKEEYAYNPATLQLVRKIRTFPDAYELVSMYTYPNDIRGSVYEEMTKRHILSPVIEEKYIKDGSLLACKLQEYKQDIQTDLLLPSKIHFSEIKSLLPDSTFTFSGEKINAAIYPSDNMEFRKYDSYGNAVHVMRNGVVNLVYLWGYGGQYPIAEISGASYEEVCSALQGKSPESFSSLISPDFSAIDSLRERLPEAHVVTYKYEPGIGMTEKTSSAGHSTGYEYDGLGRLLRIYMKEQGLEGVEKECTLKMFNYHYRENL